MDTQTIFLAKLAITRGVRNGVVKIALEESEDWGDEYTATLQIAGQPEERLYRGEDAEQARAAVKQVVADRELFVKHSARSLAGVAASTITPTQFLVNFNS